MGPALRLHDWPGSLGTPGLTLEEAGGNYVSVDIGNGVFAYYGHLVPGSPTVMVGDKVERGQVIGRVGNSGNTLPVHLHFQLQKTAAQTMGDNVPFEIDTSTSTGSFDWIEGSFRFDSYDAAVCELMGQGSEVEVLRPVELRETMAGIGRRMAALHERR